MALCFRFTSSTFSEILSMKPRISSTCGPKPGDQEKIHRRGLGPMACPEWGQESGLGPGFQWWGGWLLQVPSRLG